MTMAQHPSMQKMHRYCQAEGCNYEVIDYLFMCGNHWAMVPDKMKMRLADAYVIGQENDVELVTMNYLDAAMQCINFVALKERRRTT